MEELWRDIPGYTWGYQASNRGNIRSKNYQGTSEVKILHPRKNRHGYCEVTLWENKKAKTVTVHKLIALTFLHKTNSRMIVNHKNGNKLDNRVDNLEWVTPQYNAWHSVNILHKNIKPIYCVETGDRFWSASEAGRKLGIDSSHISAVARGRRKTAGGFSFRYEEQDQS